MAESKYYLTKEMAIEALTNAVDEVYKSRPLRLMISLEGAVNKLPMIHVEYDGFAFDKAVGKEVQTCKDYEEEEAEEWDRD